MQPLSIFPSTTMRKRNLAPSAPLRFSSIIDNFGREIVHPDHGAEYHIQHMTSLFRTNAQVLALPKILKERFPEGCPIYCYACSDGSEPYSLAMTLIEQLGEKQAQKYLPIIARDISPEVLTRAKSGYICLDSDTKAYMGHSLKYDFDKYFSPVPIRNPASAPWYFKTAARFPKLRKLLPFVEKYLASTQDKYASDSRPEEAILHIDEEWGKGERLFEVHPRLRRAVRFEEADLIKDSEAGKIFERPGVLLFNNQLIHFPEPLRKSVLKVISSQMKPGSLFAANMRIPEWETYGLKPIHDDKRERYIMEKL